MDTPSIFFALLRSGMTGKPIPQSELPVSIDWGEVIALAKKHTVYGIIIESVQYLPESLRPTPEITAKMSRFALGLIQANIITDRAVGRLVNFFREHGINGVLLKGQGIARLYRDPGMRQNGDIDFYVGKRVYREAVELCKKYLIKPGEESEENTQHFGFSLGGVPVELHRIATIAYSPFVKGRLQRWIEDQLEESPERRALTIGDAEVTLPSLDFDVIYIFYHAWRHYLTGGVGLRQLCDWAMIFLRHAEDLDRERIVSDLRRFDMTKGWKLFACIAVQYLGVPATSIPLYDPRYVGQSRRVFEEIMTGGNFGRYLEVSPVFDTKSRGLGDELRKIPVLTKYFLSLFTLIPAEATFLYFHRLTSGITAFIKRKAGK